MVTDEERLAFGWLGRIPKEVLESPREVVLAWKKLSEDAKTVARMRSGARKIEAAKEIESRYYGVLSWARNEIARRKS